MPIADAPGPTHVKHMAASAADHIADHKQKFVTQSEPGAEFCAIGTWVWVFTQLEPGVEFLRH